MKKPRKDGTLQGVFCRNSNAKIEKQTSKSNQKYSSEMKLICNIIVGRTCCSAYGEPAAFWSK